MLRALGRVPRLWDEVKTTREGAYYRPAERHINMGQEVAATGHGRGVWRHEYGHHIDHMRASGGNTYASSGARYTSARGADEKVLAKHWGRNRAESVAKTSKWDEQAKGILKMDSQKRAEAVDRMLGIAKLDRDEVVAFLTREGPLGGEVPWAANRDAIIWRFAKAYKERDSQGMANLLNVTKEVRTYTSGIGQHRKAQVWVHDNAGAGKMFSDMIDAMSHGRAHAGWLHSRKYYAEVPGRRNAEIYADQVSIMGSGTMGELLLRRFAPKLYAQTSRSIAGFKDKK